MKVSKKIKLRHLTDTDQIDKLEQLFSKEEISALQYEQVIEDGATHTRRHTLKVTVKRTKEYV